MVSRSFQSKHALGVMRRLLPKINLVAKVMSECSRSALACFAITPALTAHNGLCRMPIKRIQKMLMHFFTLLSMR
ncbi:hypothetical protein B9Z44_02480 [Limnohabitans curvus]|uniref:Uncharacterized protein n=1 Tax=Limnohabitans curvus TaxID=323423 RepID=A0A315EMS9_9BURK|nr:hypothetical protein B9Z44_02480 [Limnohabitans curvus]